jgi:hypothetical protein
MEEYVATKLDDYIGDRSTQGPVEKAVWFQKLPPILTFQLNRCVVNVHIHIVLHEHTHIYTYIRVYVCMCGTQGPVEKAVWFQKLPLILTFQLNRRVIYVHIHIVLHEHTYTCVCVYVWHTRPCRKACMVSEMATDSYISTQ